MSTIGLKCFLPFQTLSLMTSEISPNHSIDFIGLWITYSIFMQFLLVLLSFPSLSHQLFPCLFLCKGISGCQYS